MEELQYHQETISLKNPKTGQEISDAVNSLANYLEGIRFYSRKLPGRRVPRIVGLTSSKEGEAIHILTGENLDKTELVLDETYEEIAVASSNELLRKTEFDGSSLSEESITASIRAIAERLMNILN